MSITKSYAYLDPGSVSIIQIIISSVVGAFASLAVYWNKFKSFLSNIFKKKNIKKNQDK